MYVLLLALFVRCVKKEDDHSSESSNLGVVSCVPD
jgi:hypothetical protein